MRRESSRDPAATAAVGARHHSAALLAWLLSRSIKSRFCSGSAASIVLLESLLCASATSPSPCRTVDQYPHLPGSSLESSQDTRTPNSLSLDYSIRKGQLEAWRPRRMPYRYSTPPSSSKRSRHVDQLVLTRPIRRLLLRASRGQLRLLGAASARSARAQTKTKTASGNIASTCSINSSLKSRGSTGTTRQRTLDLQWQALDTASEIPAQTRWFRPRRVRMLLREFFSFRALGDCAARLTAIPKGAAPRRAGGLPITPRQNKTPATTAPEHRPLARCEFSARPASTGASPVAHRRLLGTTLPTSTLTRFSPRMSATASCPRWSRSRRRSGGKKESRGCALPLRARSSVPNIRHLLGPVVLLRRLRLRPPCQSWTNSTRIAELRRSRQFQGQSRPPPCVRLRARSESEFLRTYRRSRHFLSRLILRPRFSVAASLPLSRLRHRPLLPPRLRLLRQSQPFLDPYRRPPCALPALATRVTQPVRLRPPFPPLPPPRLLLPGEIRTGGASRALRLRPLQYRWDAQAMSNTGSAAKSASTASTRRTNTSSQSSRNDGGSRRSCCTIPSLSPLRKTAAT